jgi:hypothetical protein
MTALEQQQEARTLRMENDVAKILENQGALRDALGSSRLPVVMGGEHGCNSGLPGVMGGVPGSSSGLPGVMGGVHGSSSSLPGALLVTVAGKPFTSQTITGGSAQLLVSRNSYTKV